MLAFDRRAAKVTWTASLVLLALFATYSIRRTLFIFLLAVFFSYMVYPAVSRLARFAPKRLSHTAATAIIFVLLLLLVAGLAALVGPPIADQAAKLGEQLPSLLRDPKVFDRIPLPDWLAPFRTRVANFVREHLEQGTSIALPIARQVGQVALSVASNLIFVVLIPILSFLLITNGAQMRVRFLAWVSRGGRRSMWRGIVDDLDTLLGRYILALLILSTTTLVVYSIFFTVVGVPYSLLLAAVAGVLEFIPVIGPVTAAATILIVAGLSGYDHLLWLVIFLGVYRLFQDYVLNPYLMSDGVEVPPLLVLFGLLAGEEIGGVVGIFLSVPALAAAKICFTHIARAVRREEEAELEGDAQPVLAAEAAPRLGQGPEPMGAPASRPGGLGGA